MGWTHDYSDVSRTRRRTTAAGTYTAMTLLPPGPSHLGLHRILGRRARWVGARLRHVRD
ncbi:hypothetical protein [Actinacidiphila rubida]|uniref:hypothetical protein n=1 Tax=Actinacidiphila rubida TaxID=310780 RepID=UPI00159F0906|nr:hypothetical protein [Actinacidiphila rubida]